MEYKRIISFIIAISIAINVFIFSNITALAHESMLDVEYDICIPENSNDGINELWYVLYNEDEENDEKHIDCYHISHNTFTIKYYFAETDLINSEYTWTTDVEIEEAQNIKDAYADSMKKWNNVYFYSYSSTGSIEKHKIINIVEGTASDYNLIICPVNGINNATASVQKLGYKEDIEDGAVKHTHYDRWYMKVNVDYFRVNPFANSEDVQKNKAMAGAHEMGHILGLRDVDKYGVCQETYDTNHHAEILMGYGGFGICATDITYKDIAGVAITRGFHTDNDHKWLNMGLQSDGKYKILCSICNGVKYVSSLSGYAYDSYNACNGNHNLSSGNMMAVASYGTSDYYKCKYCRYVAPFSSIVAQNYIKTEYSDSLHQCTNSVNGLNYSFYENHTFENNYCTECGAHDHTYGIYMYNDNRTHKGTCSCGSYKLESHYVRYSDIVNNRYANCLGCLRRLDLNSDIAGIIRSGYNIVTENGSYILPSGVIVLVDADVEAYINGTLQINVPNN